MPQLSVAELDGFFSSLTNTATTEKDILSALVKSNATITTSNASLTAIVANLKKQLANLGKTPHRETTRQSSTCPNFKKEVYHSLEDC